MAPVPNQKSPRAYFEIASPHPKAREIFTADDLMKKLKEKSHAKIVLTGKDDPKADLALRISGKAAL